MSNPYPVKVIWNDAAASLGWNTEEDAGKYTPSKIITYGWLVNKTSQHVSIAKSKHDRGGKDLYGDVLDVPIQMVKSITRVK